MSLITVGIPVYNAMPYLPESIESILGQSYGDFEILAINDGSTDASMEYLRSVRDPRLRVMTQSNLGITATLNRMLAEAGTPWLARHDADDVAYPNRIARSIEYIARFPNAGMFYSLAEYYPKGSVGRFRATKGTPAEIRQLVLSGRLPALCHPTVTLNIKAVVNSGGYRFNLHVEDIDLWWRLALQNDIRLIPEVTLGFRQNLQSVCSANLAAQSINTLYVQYLLLSHVWGRTPLPYEHALPTLTGLLDPSALSFRSHIRAFNVALGQREHGCALRELMRAWLASPAGFLRRVADEWMEKRMVSLGEDPECFTRLENLLWPVAQAASKNEVSSVNDEPSARRHPFPNNSPAPSRTDPMKNIPGIPPVSSYSLLGIRVDAFDMHSLVRVTAEIIAAGKSHVIAYHNMHSFYIWYHNAKMREFFSLADHTYIDGMPLIAMGRIMGLPLQRQHRTTNLDLLPLIAAEAARQGWRIFFLGSKPTVGEKAAKQMRKNHPGLKILTYHGHFNPARSGQENQAVLSEIRAYAPHILLVGMGMPRQELWILENRREIVANVICPVGAIMDYLAGVVPTPPRWLGPVGLEWLYRLLAEPARLSRRYLWEPWFVLGKMTSQYLREGRRQSRLQ
jgi:exopolysaccharide biosynthesis WecB/TagA/CpsF family protein